VRDSLNTAGANFTARFVALQIEVQQQRELIQQKLRQSDKHQSILAVQFRRIADIQAELDLVKATVRLAAPERLLPRFRFRASVVLVSS
jgi:hypothetical protein